MTYCAVTADCNRHEVEEARAELRWQRNEDRYWAAIETPIVRYKVDGAWTIEDAERLYGVLKVIIGEQFQVVLDNTLENDTDWALQGVAHPADDLVNDVLDSVFGSRAYGVKQAKSDLEDFIGGMRND